MKNIIILFLSFYALELSAQINKFTFDENGLTKFIVVELDTINKSVIYQKTIDWVKETYKKPDLVFDATINNENIRFSGKENIFKIYNAFGDYGNYPLEYTIKVSIKNGKYKFEVVFINVIHPSINFNDIHKTIYKKDGKLSKWYRDCPKIIEDYFNNLNKSLYEYISNKNSNDW